MTSIISALSLFVLVLASGCFALPLVNQQFLTSTLSSFNEDLTTEKIANLRLVSDDETTELPSGEFQMSTSNDNLLPAKISRVSRIFDEFPTAESFTSESTTEQSAPYKREYDEFSTSEPFTTEQSVPHKREYDELFTSESFTVEPTTEQSVPHRRQHDEFSTSESFTVEPTTEQLIPHKRVYDELLMTTIESITQDLDHSSRNLELSSENATESEFNVNKRNYDNSVYGEASKIVENSDNEYQNANTDSEKENNENESNGLNIDSDNDNRKRQIPIESTTYFMPSFTSTSSAVAPELYVTESYTSTSPSTSTKKYTGLLTDDEQPQHETDDEEPYEKSEITTIKTTVDSEDDTKDSHIPIAEFDQSALNNVGNIPNNFMILDEKNDIVTAIQIQASTTQLKKSHEEQKLNQGKQSSFTEEEKSDN